MTTNLERTVTDLLALDSATKYPSIDTYHALDPSNGKLTESVMPFTGEVVLTEKVDGTNGRIVLMPDGDYFIGSRDALLYASGDRIINPNLGIVATLKPLAERIVADWPMADSVAVPQPELLRVLFLEVYGGKVGGNAKQYTSTGTLGYRLFDHATVTIDVLCWPREKIASWREHGGQQWATEQELRQEADVHGIDLTPRLATVWADDLPTGLEDTHKWLADLLPRTNVALDENALGRAEGIVLRTLDRSTIAKARFQDYERTFRSARGKSDRGR